MAIRILACSFLLLYSVCCDARSGKPVSASIEGLQKQLESANGEQQRLTVLVQLVEADHDYPMPDTLLYGDQAVAALANQPNRALETRLRLALSRAYETRGKHDAALTHATKAYALAEQGNDSHSSALAKRHSAAALTALGENQSALQDIRRAMDLIGDAPGAASIYRLAGVIYKRLNDDEESLKHVFHSLHLAEQAGDESNAARALNNIAMVYWEKAQYDQAEEYFLHALEHFRAESQPQSLALVLNNLGMVYRETGRLNRALDYLQEGYAIISAIDAPRVYAIVLENLGLTHEALGNVAQALSYLNSAESEFNSQSSNSDQARTKLAIARLQRSTGDLQQARATLLQALQSAQAANSRKEQAQVYGALADLHEAQNDTINALRFIRARDHFDQQLRQQDVSRVLAELESERALAMHQQELIRQERWQITLVLVSIALLLIVAGLYAITRRRGRSLAKIHQSHLDLQQATQKLSESENRYRSLFEDAVIPKLLVNIAARSIVDSNQSAADLANIQRRELQNMSIDHLTPPWLREAALQSQQLGHSEMSVSADWTSEEGHRRNADIRLAPVKLQGESCALVTVHDQTHARRLEEERARADKLESLGVVAGGIAHDFNNALVSVLGPISLARHTAQYDIQITDLLTKAEAAVDHCVQLTSRLLTFAKGGEPKRELHNIATLISEGAELWHTGSVTRLSLCIAHDLWNAEVDQAQFNQMLGNLIRNGVQAMQDSGVLTVRADNYLLRADEKHALAPGKYVRIKIIDQGPGIPKELQSKILDPYFTTKQHGTGLGLASAFTIAKSHGGWLELDSSSNQGSTFSVLLPAIVDLPRHLGEPAHQHTTGNNESLLIMDDDPNVQEIYRLSLEELGYRTVIVGDGLSAVDTYRTALATGKRFDLVIMDLTVPGGMGGATAMKEILQFDPTAVGIVSSGYSSDPTMSRYREAGFAASLSKPFSLSAMNGLIRQVLDGVAS